MALVRIESLNGIPLFYDRFSPTAYGVEAVPMRPFIDETFRDECDAAFARLQGLLTQAGFEITEIWSGGVGREGSGRSLHHQSRAFDLDALIFANGTKWVADTFPHRPLLYLAIEACLRRHFGTVLNYDYNRAHEDHFHFDNGTRVGFKRDARSHALFVQHALTKLFNQDVGEAGVDGVFGPDTEAALSRARRELGLGGLSERANWDGFLDACARNAGEMERRITRAPA